MARPTQDDQSRSENDNESDTTFQPTLPATTDGKMGIIHVFQGRNDVDPDDGDTITLSTAQGWSKISGSDGGGDGSSRRVIIAAFAKADMSASETAPTFQNSNSHAGAWAADITMWGGAATDLDDVTGAGDGAQGSSDDFGLYPSATVNVDDSMAYRTTAVSNDRDGSESLPTGHTLVTGQDGDIGGGSNMSGVSSYANADTSSIALEDSWDCWSGMDGGEGLVGVTSIIPPASGGGTTFTQSVSGSITPSGNLVLKVLLVSSLGGSIAPAGALFKKTFKSFAGSIAPVGQIAKMTAKALSGSITPSGTVSTLIVIQQAVAGSVTAAGSLTKKISVSLAGSVTPAGAIAGKSVKKVVGGTISLTGVLTRKTAKALSGSITPSGAVSGALRLSQSAAGTITAAGALATQKIAGGASTFIGGIRRLALKIGIGL